MSSAHGPLPSAPCPSPTAWPGGMRGAIEYGQPLLRAQPCGGKSKKADSEIRFRFGKRAKQSLGRLRGFRRAQSHPTPSNPFLHFSKPVFPSFLLHFPRFSLHFAIFSVSAPILLLLTLILLPPMPILLLPTPILLILTSI